MEVAGPASRSDDGSHGHDVGLRLRGADGQFSVVPAADLRPPPGRRPAAVLLGPWAGAVVIAAVLIVQCLLFGDGGVTALGANFVNMGLIGSIGGYAIYAPIRRAIGGPSGVLIGGMVAAWFSVILASGAFAVELAASVGWSNFFNVLGWMALVHAGIGLGEALITGAVLRFLLLIRPDLIEQPGPTDLSPPGVGAGRGGRPGHRHRRGGVPGPVRFRVRRWPGVGRRQTGFPERRGSPCSPLRFPITSFNCPAFAT